MDITEAIMTRRSIRKFQETPLSEEQIRKYLEAANMAPTATNRQPWRFMVVKRAELKQIEGVMDASFRERVTALSDEEYREYQGRLEKIPIPGEGSKVENMQKFFRTMGNAPVAVLVYVDQSSDPWISFLNIQDASAAIQNMILAAWGDGVGSCWMCGPFIKKYTEIKDFFGLHDKQLIALVPLGYPEVTPSPPPKDDVRDKTIWFGKQ